MDRELVRRIQVEAQAEFRTRLTPVLIQLPEVAQARVEEFITQTEFDLALVTVCDYMRREQVRLTPPTAAWIVREAKGMGLDPQEYDFLDDFVGR